MPIEVTCKACGKTLKARDEAAGKRTSCPDCGTEMRIPEVTEYAYEEEEEEYEEEDDSYGMQAEPEYDELPEYDEPPRGRSRDDDRGRKPCRACGEMIVSTAAKCRFCGEVLDRSLRGSRRVRSSGELDRQTISEFKSSVKTAGGIWLASGIIALGFIMLTMGMGGGRMLGMLGGLLVVVAMISVVWIVIGGFAIARHMWAIWTGLVLSYLSLVGNVMSMVQGDGSGVCPIAFVIISLVHGHRAIKHAKTIREAGRSVLDV